MTFRPPPLPIPSLQTSYCVSNHAQNKGGSRVVCSVAAGIAVTPTTVLSSCPLRRAHGWKGGVVRINVRRRERKKGRGTSSVPCCGLAALLCKRSEPIDKVRSTEGFPTAAAWLAPSHCAPVGKGEASTSKSSMTRQPKRLTVQLGFDSWSASRRSESKLWNPK